MHNLECAPDVGHVRRRILSGRAVDLLELDRAQVAERGMEPAFVVDLVDGAGEVGGDVS
jgi:hypothetical protein